MEEKKKNNFLYVSILGGAIACFMIIAMVFMFPSNESKNLKGRNSNSWNEVDNSICNNTIRGIDENVNLGDTRSNCASVIPDCLPSYSLVDNIYCRSKASHASENCDAENEEFYMGACYYKRAKNNNAGKCATCSSGDYLLDGSCYKCPAGSSCENSTKTPCTGDQYQDEEGQPSCKDCLNGTPNDNNTECITSTPTAIPASGVCCCTPNKSSCSWKESSTACNTSSDNTSSNFS